jgi:hypothetical protein
MGGYRSVSKMVLRRNIVRYHSRDGGLREKTKELFTTGTTK